MIEVIKRTRWLLSCCRVYGAIYETAPIYKVILEMKKIFIGLFLLTVVSLACDSPKKTESESFNINPFQFSVQKKVVCENGAVVSAHPLASKVGVGILKKG